MTTPSIRFIMDNNSVVEMVTDDQDVDVTDPEIHTDFAKFANFCTDLLGNEDSGQFNGVDKDGGILHHSFKQGYEDGIYRFGLDN